MQMFIVAGWRDGMKNGGRMRDSKSLFWILLYVKVSQQRQTILVIFCRSHHHHFYSTKHTFRVRLARIIIAMLV